MMSLPSASGALFSSFIVSLHTIQLKRPISGLLSSFNDILGARTGSLPLRLLPSLPGDKTCSIFRIGRVSLGLFLAGKVSHRKAVSFDGPPTLGRATRSGLCRHPLIGLVVGHVPFAFSFASWAASAFSRAAWIVSEDVSRVR